MTVEELIVKYHKTVPFPWTVRKIRKAGFAPTEFLLRLGRELNQCTDANSETAKALVEMLNQLDLLEQKPKKSKKKVE